MNYELCIMNQNLGGYSSGVPPLPIPNREVKPTRADGTALHRGRVGRRRFSETSKIQFFGVSLFYTLPLSKGECPAGEGVCLLLLSVVS